ncbi:YecA family protein [Salinibius halmophilus]|uniref:YecA family protein n=1 Tax=Salinibius halmophilus TaxID=1853216 RepID=UPI000E66AE21|nr:SEC-C metal-binding domain-containing protein [Salinibius halmophilus]
MKIGRNDTCPCGSGKKFKKCCINVSAGPIEQVAGRIESVLAGQPDMSMADIQQLASRGVDDFNHAPLPELFGLSPHLMANWQGGDWGSFEHVSLQIPKEHLHYSVVYAYIKSLWQYWLIEGDFKLTAKGNLPRKLVEKVNYDVMVYMPDYAEVLQSIKELTPGNAEDFPELSLTHKLLLDSGLLRNLKTKFSFSAKASLAFHEHGISALYIACFEFASRNFNYGYYDYEDETVLGLIRLTPFILWRLQQHKDIDLAARELVTAIPALANEFKPKSGDAMAAWIKVFRKQFVETFLNLFGLVKINGWGEFGHRDCAITPLFDEVLQFNVHSSFEVPLVDPWLEGGGEAFFNGEIDLGREQQGELEKEFEQFMSAANEVVADYAEQFIERRNDLAEYVLSELSGKSSEDMVSLIMATSTFVYHRHSDELNRRRKVDGKQLDQLVKDAKRLFQGSELQQGNRLDWYLSKSANPKTILLALSLIESIDSDRRDLYARAVQVAVLKALVG